MKNYKTLLEKIVAVLKEGRFKTGDNRRIDFLKYCEERKKTKSIYGDEDSLVTPVLVEILEVLGYKSGINIVQQSEIEGNIPDFRSLKTNKFILDAKSTGTDIVNRGKTTKTPVQQIERYLKELRGYKYGILFNLEKFEIYERTYDQDEQIKIFRLDNNSLNLKELYRLFLENEYEGSEEFEKFKWFVDNFEYREISQDEIIEEIKNRDKKDLAVPDKKILKTIVYRLIQKIQRDIEHQIEKYPEDSDELMRLDFELSRMELELNLEEGEDKRKITLDEFIKQASYVVLMKLILVRILEDNDFIEKNLYNGRFKEMIKKPYKKSLKRILYDARYQAKDYYPYFYDGSPFDFEISDDELFIEMLFELSKINFAAIHFDLIGDLYEHYLNLDERKEKGQYYTPHYIVEFLLDRVGFTGKVKGEIDKRTVLDPAAGSGGFLVEAAKRLREAGNNKEFEAKKAITMNLYGVEITPFAAFLAEINLIMQILPLIRKIPNEAYRKISSLKMFHQDSLMGVYNRQEINGDEKVKPVKSHILAGDKELKFYELVNRNDIDFVIGNPPYVGEKGHKELFRPLQNHEYWKNHYLGKSDYLYYFIILGLSKLKDGGRLAFITTQYWLTADGAKNLRKYILDTSKIVEIVDFKGIRLFPEAPGQENIVFVLEKCENEEERLNNKIKIVQFNKDWVLSEENYVDSHGRVLTNFDRWIELLRNPKQYEVFSDVEKTNFMLGKTKREEIADVYYSGVSQGELNSDAWYLYDKEKPVELSGNFQFLTEPANVNQGIVSGADRINKKNIKKLSKSTIHKYKIEIGDPIFIFDKKQLEELNLNEKESDIIKPFYKNSDIKRGYVDFNNEEYVIYTPSLEEVENFQVLKQHLKKYDKLLNDRREVLEGKIRWYDLWWSRNIRIFESEKLVTSRRAKRNTFAYENHSRYPQSDITIITKKESTRENLKYLWALLNSKFLDDWYGKNTKMKGDIREYYYTPLSKIPIRKIDFEDENETKVHKILGGIYSPIEVKDKAYEYEPYTHTWIKQKGLTDYYIILKNQLYELAGEGFGFNPESALTRKDQIKVNLFKLTVSLRAKDYEVNKFEDVAFFNNFKNEIGELEEPEQDEFENLIEKCSFFVDSPSKDLQIKKTGELAGEGLTLFEPQNKLKGYGFKYSLELITTENSIITVEIKSKEEAETLVNGINRLFDNKNIITWKELKTIPFINSQINDYISEKKEMIFNALKPVDEKVDKRLQEIFESNEEESFEKIQNIHYLQRLIDLYVEHLYKNKGTIKWTNNR